VYERVPFPAKIKEYEDGVRTYFGETEHGPARAEARFEAFLRESYTKAADRNADTNLKRSAYLYRANGTIIIAFVLVALAFIPHIGSERLANCQSKGNCNAGRTRDSTNTAAPATVTPGAATKH